MSQYESLKIPPHDVQSEQSVLGGLMLAGLARDSAAWDTVCDKLSEQDFYRQDHRLIFRAISCLASDNKPIDLVTLPAWLKSAGELENAGGFVYLASMARDTPSAANIGAYADLVKRSSVLRQLISAGTEIADKAFNASLDDAAVKGVIEFASRNVFNIEQGNGRNSKGWTDSKSAMRTTLEIMSQRAESGCSIIGSPSHLSDLDDMLSGFERQKEYLIAGRPGMGKSTLVQNIAEAFALQGDMVAYFTLEMPTPAVMEKIFASQSRVDFKKIRNPTLMEPLDWARISETIKRWGNAKEEGGMVKAAGVPLYFDDESGLTPHDISVRLRRLERDTGRKVHSVVLDHVGHMRPVGGDRGNETANGTAISKDLMALKKEFNCVMLPVCQLNRGVESRPDKRPRLSDLRESGAWEQDADSVIFVYRDEYYNKDTPVPGQAEILIAKQRSGPLGTVHSTWLGQYQRFESFTPDVYGGRYE